MSWSSRPASERDRPRRPATRGVVAAVGAVARKAVWPNAWVAAWTAGSDDVSGWVGARGWRRGGEAGGGGWRPGGGGGGGGGGGRAWGGGVAGRAGPWRPPPPPRPRPVRPGSRPQRSRCRRRTGSGAPRRPRKDRP